MRRGIGRRGPSLLGVMATTAVVAGTANAVTGSMNRHQQEKANAQQQQEYANQAAYESQAQIEQMQQQMAMQQQQLNAAQAAQYQAPAAAATPAGGISQGQIDQLTQLAQLKDAGILTEDEFNAKKKSILGI